MKQLIIDKQGVYLYGCVIDCPFYSVGNIHTTTFFGNDDIIHIATIDVKKNFFKGYTTTISLDFWWLSSGMNGIFSQFLNDYFDKNGYKRNHYLSYIFNKKFSSKSLSDINDELVKLTSFFEQINTKTNGNCLKTIYDSERNAQIEYHNHLITIIKMKYLFDLAYIDNIENNKHYVNNDKLSERLTLSKSYINAAMKQLEIKSLSISRLEYHDYIYWVVCKYGLK